MKLAIIDQSFHWPPTGGSWVDLRETALELQNQGLDVKIFTPECSRWNLPGGRIDADPGVPVEIIPLSLKQINFKTLPHRLKQAVEIWKPDRLIISNTFFLAPYLIRAFSNLPVFLRVYAHEMICLNYMGLYRGNTYRWEVTDPGEETCPYALLQNAWKCWACGLRRMAPTLIGPRLNPVAMEYWSSLAFLPGYSSIVRKSLENLKGIIVYTPFIQHRFRSLNTPVHIVPSGVDINRFKPADSSEAIVDKPVKILLSGRVDDPKKGYSIFKKSVDSLNRMQDLSFQAFITDSKKELDHPLISSTGWVDPDRLPELYRSMDIVVCPSIWQEPFGIVPLEAMACGIPVAASRIGGMQYTVQHNKTGLLHTAGNHEELTDHLRRMILDRELRIRYGCNGRAHTVSRFNWSSIVRNYILPIISDFPDKAMNWTETDHVPVS
jgi:glycosyltransferase involved in cell wall biosynthesis